MNKQKIIVACIAFVLVISTVFGQATKTSSQNITETIYVDGYGYDLNCKETYTYYIDSNGNYLRHGTYSCTGSQTFKEDWQRTGNLSISYTYKATYKDGKLNGSVTSTTTVKGSMYKRYVGTANYNTSETSTKNYKEDKLNGAYKYTKTSNGKTEKIASVNFADDKFAVGDFQFFDNEFDLDMKGKIDDEGHWSYISFNKNMIEYKMVHEFVQSKIVRDKSMQTKENKTYEIPDIIKSTPAKELTASFLLDNGYIYESDYILSSDYQINQVYKKIINIVPITLDKLPAKGYYIAIPIKFMTDDDFEALAQWLKEILRKEWDKEYNNKYNEIASKSANYNVDPGYLLVENVLKSPLRYEKTKIGCQGYKESFRLKIEKEGNEDIILSKDQEKKIFEVVDQISKEYNEKISKRAIAIITNALDEVIAWPSTNESNVKAYYNGESKGNKSNLLKQDISYTYNIFKDWLPMYSYNIDSVYTDSNVVTCLTMFTINVKGKEPNSYETYKTQASMMYFRDWVLNEEKSFKRKERIYNDWDSIISLKSTIKNNRTKIEECKNTYNDVWEEYNTHKAFKEVDTQLKDEDLKRYMPIYNNIIDTQMNYILFISSRKAIDSNTTKILTKATDYKDAQNAYNSYYQNCDFKITEISKDCQRMKQILATQDSCLSFIELRKNITNNDLKLVSFKKVAKNIYGVYASYFKEADLTWTDDNKGNDKLRNVIDVQNQFLKVMSSPNISDIDKQIKKMKDKSFENIKKQIFD